jgi:hypothetical protein
MPLEPLETSARARAALAARDHGGRDRGPRRPQGARAGPEAGTAQTGAKVKLEALATDHGVMLGGLMRPKEPQGAWQMARNDEAEIRDIRVLEAEARELGFSVVRRCYDIGDRELGDQFHWIAGHLPAERRPLRPLAPLRVRQEISKRTKELGDAVRAKHIQYHLPFSCIDDHDECVRKRKRQRKSTYLCFLALYICLARSMTALLAAITAAAKAGGLLG